MTTILLNKDNSLSELSIIRVVVDGKDVCILSTLYASLSIPKDKLPDVLVAINDEFQLGLRIE